MDGKDETVVRQGVENKSPAALLKNLKANKQFRQQVFIREQRDAYVDEVGDIKERFFKVYNVTLAKVNLQAFIDNFESTLKHADFSRKRLFYRLH